MEIEGIGKVRTRRVSGLQLNKVIEQANRADRLRGGPGFLISEDSIGRTISRDDLPQFTNNPATLAKVVNVGDETIPVYGTMGIVESFFKERGPFQHERALSVRKPTTEDAGRLAIAVDEIPPKQVGLACIAGVCIVRIVRWFTHPLLNKVSLFAGEFYSLASASGQLDIIWEETDFTGEEEHLALVGFNRDSTPLRWKNTGGSSVSFAGPVIPNKTDDSDGIESDGLYSGETPDADTEELSYINLSGSVNAGAKGSMTYGVAVGEVDQSIDVGALVGPKSGETTFIKGEPNYLNMAYLGVRQGSHYAVLRPFCPCVIKFTHRNMLDNSDADTVFQNNGILHEFYPEADPLVATITKNVLIKFARPIKNPLGGILQLQVVVSASLTIDDFEGLATFDATMRTKWVTVDWDPTAVTWNNQPATSGGDSLNAHFETDTAGTSLESLDTQDLTLNINNSHFALSPNLTGALFYGLLVSVDADADAGDAGSVLGPLRVDAVVNFANGFVAPIR